LRPRRSPALTLTAWKQANGFPATGHPDAHAIYGNLGDLRIARDMNCVQSNGNVACYVTNYDPSPYDPNNQNDHTSFDWSGGGTFTSTVHTWDFPLLYSSVWEAAGIKPSEDEPGPGIALVPFATVAMVYNAAVAASNNPANAVTFYTFVRNDLITLPALDGEGPKSNPRMCMACHGGTYDVSTHSASGASFLPFDVYFFKHISNPGFTLDDQQDAYRKLNGLVKTTNATQSIKDFIDGTYPDGVANEGSLAVDGYVPPGWLGQEKLYNSVVRQYCRMCHLSSRTPFTTFQQFQSLAQDIEQKVCDSKDMPNAQVPFAVFWVHDQIARNDLRDFLKAEGITELHGCKE
jgi:hypothetical protein